MTDIERIDALRDELNRHNYNYYVLNAPEISDRDFDMLMKELEALEAAHPEHFDPDSPTRRVGSDISSGFEQAAHIYPMLSLANTYSIDDVDAWAKRTEEALMGQKATMVGEMKFDGTGISLIYEHDALCAPSPEATARKATSSPTMCAPSSRYRSNCRAADGLISSRSAAR